MTAAPAASVIIPCYHSETTVSTCLRGLRSQRFRDFETIIVNSSPEDGTAARVQEHLPSARYEQSEWRLLPHAARNRGARHARGDTLVFTDPDCVAHPSWLEQLMAARERGHHAVVGGMGLAVGGRFALGIHLCKYSWLLPSLPPGRRSIAPTANMAISRTAWEASGPFDGDRFAGDALLSWRLSDRHGSIRFEPAAVVYHHHGGSVRSFVRERWLRGREFAAMRAGYRAWPRRRAATYALATPLLPVVVLARALRDGWRAGCIGETLSTLPLQAAGHAAWCGGEAVAFVRLALRQPVEHGAGRDVPGSRAAADEVDAAR